MSFPLTCAATSLPGADARVQPIPAVVNHASPMSNQLRMSFPFPSQHSVRNLDRSAASGHPFPAARKQPETPTLSQAPLQRAQQVANGLQIGGLLEQPDAGHTARARCDTLRRVVEVHSAQRKNGSGSTAANLRETG